MIFWYWYLLTAAALSFSGYVTLNIFLAAALAAAVPLLFRLFAAKNRVITSIITAAAAAAALALLWRGSFLPPPATIIKFLWGPKTRPTLQYLLEFLWQSVNILMLASGAALFAAVFFSYRRKPMLLAFSAYVILASALVIQPKRKTIDLDSAAQQPLNLKQNIADLDPFYTKESEWPEAYSAAGSRQDSPDLGSVSPKAFFEKESGRIVEFYPPAKDSPPFDVIILHICSLSWKDIKDSDANLIPFFSKFDYVFTNFSAAASYSGPAALRVLKAPCGQVPHLDLYKDAPAGCYLMDDLRSSGFKTYSMASNDGKYDDFAAHVKKYGHADTLIDAADLPVAYELFTGAPMYPDDAALRKFWKLRQESKAQRAALYYNTANLHIGTHKPGASGKSDNAAFYKERLVAMTAQLEGFFSEIERSGRNAVVIFVPEHGAALVSTKMQAKDVRDIPLPPIATVPAAVKLIGKKFYADEPKPKVITKPASLLALAWFISEFMTNNPFTKDARKPYNISLEIPVTDFLAENAGSTVMRLRSGYIYSQSGGPWTMLPDYAGIPPDTIPSVQDFIQRGK
ncbi:MAG: cellulose biosynthesis protein BcsG [Elusimicrobiota bacterium]|nr:cellulose biosynthesis protein BcsG [Elusimicrobiota bacterium]